MRILGLLSFLTLLSTGTYAQKDSVRMYEDKYTGNAPVKCHANNAELVLRHCLSCDDGTFTLTQTPRVSMFLCKWVIFTGEWTAVNGSTTDDNATVVKLDMKDDNLYYLRLKNGDLQQVDSTLHPIKPSSKHILKKQ